MNLTYNIAALRKEDFVKIHEYMWKITQSIRSDMRVPARIYADEKLLEQTLRDRSIEQLVNVATLPGIQKYALSMPDIHEGYGFPIGGVAAVDLEEGVVSPGGIGYDINCGVRLLRSQISYNEIKPNLEKLATEIYQAVPSGLGRGGHLKLDKSSLDEVLLDGAQKLVKDGYGQSQDLEHIEAGGRLSDADSSLVSEHAKSRARNQLGTLGSGNHFLEIQYVERILDEEAAKALGLNLNQVAILIHSGSRGLGHQTATDFIRTMMKVMPKYGISLPDRELASAPIKSKEGQDYLAAMRAAANFAWANRQMITDSVRGAWQKILGSAGGNLEIVYDVAHNIAKLEEYEVDGRLKKVAVHRKGATRAFGPGHPETPEAYRNVGQPVLIPGSMGTGSYVLVGQNQAIKESFGTTCHGAGRRMSRTQAKREVRGAELKIKLEKEGIVVRAGSMAGLAEEAPLAYKDVDHVVAVVERAGIAKRVVRLRPIGVIKG